MGDLDGVLGARGVVDGDEGALGQRVGLDGRDDDVGGSAAPVGDYRVSVSLSISLSPTFHFYAFPDGRRRVRKGGGGVGGWTYWCS